MIENSLCPYTGNKCSTYMCKAYGTVASFIDVEEGREVNVQGCKLIEKED